MTLSEAQISYIQDGGVIAYPTSTLPGLGCIPTSEGLDRLFELKARSPEKPVSIGVASLDQVRDMVEIHPDIEEFLSAFPRGCFSVIFPSKETVDKRSKFKIYFGIKVGGPQTVTSAPIFLSK